jgi:hypothetical protein
LDRDFGHPSEKEVHLLKLDANSIEGRLGRARRRCVARRGNPDRGELDRHLVDNSQELVDALLGERRLAFSEGCERIFDRMGTARNIRELHDAGRAFESVCEAQKASHDLLARSPPFDLEHPPAKAVEQFPSFKSKVLVGVLSH